MLYEEVFRKFEAAGIRYLVVGGIAVNLHGYARMTVDLDLMLDLSQENLARVVTALEEMGYVPRVPVKTRDLASEEKRKAWREEKGALVMTFYDPKAPFRQIDIFLENPLDFAHAYQRPRWFELRGVRVPVASIEDLIQMKSGTGRPRDQEDLHHLDAIKNQNGRP
jgi:hypothetical protein